MPSVSGCWRMPVTELATVIWRPSRIQAAPRPATIRVWKGDQLIRSSRAGMVERIDFPTEPVDAVMAPFPPATERCEGIRSSDLLQSLREDDPRGRLDEGEVREGLGHVAQVAAGPGFELLRIQAERRGDPEQAIHEGARPVDLAHDRQGGDEPEGA